MKTVTGWLTVLIIAGLAALGGLSFWYWGAPAKTRRALGGPVEKITLSTSADTKSALVFIAQDKGYFSENGLEVTLKTFSSGKMGCDQLKAGAVDIANFADFVLVGQALDGDRALRCLGAIAAADDHSVIFLKDGGIKAPGDLRGKRVGAARGTTAEFFWGRFLVFNDLGLKDVQLIDVKPPALEAALTTRQVDAILVWEHWAEAIREHLGDKISRWPGQSGQKYYWLLVTTEALVKARQGVWERLFKALQQAEIFLQNQPEAGVNVIAQQINLSPAMVKEALTRSSCALSFNQSLLITMEDEARWMIKNHLTAQTEVPNYLDYMYVAPLAKVDLQAVSIITPPR
jgi:ABC-type nitrate/sulfonate/bicarbonate transport system substrate-binding protein